VLEKSRSIAQKFVSVIMLTSVLTLFLVVSVFFGYQIFSYYESLRNDLDTQANIIADSSTAALSFYDEKRATEILSRLKIKPNIVKAAIFDSEDKIFASYYRSGKIAEKAFRELKSGYRFSIQGLDLFRPIMVEGIVEGHVYIYSDFTQFESQIKRFGLVLLVIVTFSVFMARIMAYRLSKKVTNPIHDLALSVRQVAETKDYSLKANKVENDEIGLLTDDFNFMLQEIQNRDQYLKEVQDGLEETVVTRTADLNIALNKATTADRAKMAFLANMSHEIRTPMTAILGFVDLLSRSDSSPSDYVENIQTIRRNGEHLLTVINDILDISKIEAGQMTVEKIDFDLLRVVSDVSSLMRAKALDKMLSFNVAFESKIPKFIRSDQVRLRQILTNLLGNAIKFTESGGITLRISVDPTKKLLAIQVKDTGIGLTDTQQKLLFQPFIQADESTTRKFGGTGLGLSISKNLAEQLGGGISVTSAPDLGSLFTVTVVTGNLDNIEYLDDPDKALLMLSEESQSGLENKGKFTDSPNILLIEDGLDNQKLIAFHLRKMGAIVEIQENGKTGSDAALDALKKGQDYDLIFCDMQMPIMDGYTAVRRLREHHYTKPIVAITAHAMQGDREKCMNAGCTDYTTKPISVDQLYEMVSKYARVDAHEISVGTDKERQSLEFINTSVDDKSPLKSTFSGRPDFEELITIFVEAMPARIQKLDQQVIEKDFVNLQVTVHQLKGCAGGYGFDIITNKARNLENALKENKTNWKHYFDELMVFCRRVEL
jgi:two-component system, sensor histidine kinase